MVHPTSTTTQQDSTLVAELSWDQIMAGDFPTADEQHHAAFVAAVRQAAAAMDANAQIPTASRRLALAMDLVLTGAVTIESAMAATVRSGDTTYHLTPLCTCHDSQHRSKWCKHYMARHLLTLTRTLMGDAPEAEPEPPEKEETMPRNETPEPPAANGRRDVPPARPEAPAPAPAALPEAPYSVNVRVNKGGYDLQLTVRKGTSAEFFLALEGLLAWLPANGFAPAGRPAAPAPAATPTPTSQAWCAVHQCAFEKHTNDRGSWLSHRTADGGWCKPPRDISGE